MDYDTIVMGGGGSGMMAAIVASRHGQKVLIIEKNKSLGEKLKITGGGRCNIFNKEEDLKKLLANYGDSAKYLYSPFTKFGVFETEEFFKNLGIEVKVEDRKRAFPKSEKAHDVFAALEKELEKNKVEIKFGSSLEKIIVDGGTVTSVKIKGDENIYTAKKYILATGGYSHPETGSTGDGFKFLKSLNLGIKVEEPTPSLVPVSVENTWVKKLSGKTVENIKITFSVDNVKKKVLKPVTETKNRILFTHFGLSGPTILNLSKNISDWLKEGEVTLQVDLFPSLDESELNKFILKIFENNKNKVVKNILNDIYPGNILEEIFLEDEVLKNILQKQVNDVRVEERKVIINILKNLKINITGLMGFDKAIIADGGVEVDEVNFDNMSLKKIPNLFVTGDMLNISRPSGGYSLQLCWTTGFVAGGIL
jgi:predicted Rossmann fold flavoprotein